MFCVETIGWEQRGSCQTFMLPVLRWLVKLRNCVESARPQGGAAPSQNKQDELATRTRLVLMNTVLV